MTEEDFTARHYGPRASAYVASAVHAQGADLDEVAALLAGRGFGRVLDLGCGGGHVSYRAAPHAGEVVAADVTPPMLDEVAREAARRNLPNITTANAAAEALPFPDADFDAVLSRFSAHHWRDFATGLRQARRVAKPGALAVFIDTTAPAAPVLDTHLQTMELLRDASHVRNYSVAEWAAELSRAGFALRGFTARRLPLDFASWTARTSTALEFRAAIRALQTGAPEAVRAHFAVAADGSFTIDTASFVAEAV
ncbi:class I SAM-dependent methyltransferase [Acidocella sp. KAb 2-4]|uniref:class I SAM-dependent methyltransferase n=1 Tax=Acidocella sp. KAb 2-4 TaxID=2885158 RepID=UPI001D084B04|nr:class I SAM-dependent methyltransferase [Acidocella sp. KAb 2-4]MCB5943860.1 class I SAM-dependent methyltransferase [Acidocella sp. KAb 2-4]